MNEKYSVFLVSNPTGETLGRIFLSRNLNSVILTMKKEFVFIRTEQQIEKIINESKLKPNSIILYTIVETKKLAKFITKEVKQTTYLVLEF